ncbi:hypothetical protein HanIR_Chr17g0859571 [Helianthus annuus]|nr:hypothetical protein HanIR_Chr17g0859571 [Helianthus annuus]
MVCMLSHPFCCRFQSWSPTCTDFSHGQLKKKPPQRVRSLNMYWASFASTLCYV